jgi:hypothetical protein
MLQSMTLILVLAVIGTGCGTASSMTSAGRGACPTVGITQTTSGASPLTPGVAERTAPVVPTARGFWRGGGGLTEAPTPGGTVNNGGGALNSGGSIIDE